MEGESAVKKARALPSANGRAYNMPERNGEGIALPEDIRHVFVINPAAGRENAAADIARRIQAHGTTDALEMYVTRAPGDATAFVRASAAQNAQRVRFYACGGDGTLNEVVNGAAGFPNASVSAWPCGSGNDYVKYYGSRERFLNFEALVSAQDNPVDLMLVNGERYAINMVHFGLDSAVAQTMERVRRWPLLGGRNAYATGVVKALITSVRNACEVSVDGQARAGVPLLLCTIACGRYVGGGFLTAPRSDNQDGLLDVLMVKAMSRLRIPGLIQLYRKGRHMQDARLAQDVIYQQGTQVRVRMPERSKQLLDGEIVRMPDMTVRVVPKAIRFAVPSAG